MAYPSQSALLVFTSKDPSFPVKPDHPSHSYVLWKCPIEVLHLASTGTKQAAAGAHSKAVSAQTTELQVAALRGQVKQKQQQSEVSKAREGAELILTVIGAVAIEGPGCAAAVFLFVLILKVHVKRPAGNMTNLTDKFQVPV